MNRNFEDRKSTKPRITSRENKTIIKALNMYGRVPEQWELLEEIERLNNIINELEEYIKPFLYMLNGITDRDVYEQCQLDDFTMIMEKLQELKGHIARFGLTDNIKNKFSQMEYRIGE